MRKYPRSVVRACRMVRLSRTANYPFGVPASRRDAAVIAALTDAVTPYQRWGFWKLFDRLRVEGRSRNHKHVHRLYWALRLNLPRRTTRRVPRSECRCRVLGSSASSTSSSPTAADPQRCASTTARS